MPLRLSVLAAASLVVVSVLGSASAVAAAGGGEGTGSPGPIVYARLTGAGQQLWTLMPGDEPVVVPGTEGARSARWSPDGRVIAFARWADGIFLVNPDGSGLRQLFVPAEGEHFGEPLWSPDGTHLAFGVLPAGGSSYHIEIADSLDGERAVLPTDLAYITDWLPDGTFLGAIVSNGQDPATGQFIHTEELGMTTPNGVTTAITSTDDVHEGVPRLSPDGKTLTFLEYRETPGPSYAIAVMRLDGSERRTLVSLGSEMTWPAWSPDGIEVLYGYVPTAVALDGSTRHLTDAGSGQDGLDWAALPGTVQAPPSATGLQLAATATVGGVRALALPDPSTKASAAISRTTIWPRRDGYRDIVRITQRMREPARSTINVYNSHGTRVRHVVIGYRTGLFGYAWNGRTAGGKVLASGRYRIVVSAYDLAGNQLRHAYEVMLHRGRP